MTRLLRYIPVFIVYVAVCQTAVTTRKATAHPKPTSTHSPTTTRENNELDAYFFSYYAHTHEFFAKIDIRSDGNIHRNCYILKLSAQEQQYIHTTFGLRTIELKSMAQIQNNTPIPVNKTSLRNYQIGQCGRVSDCSYFKIEQV